MAHVIRLLGTPFVKKITCLFMAGMLLLILPPAHGGQAGELLWSRVLGNSAAFDSSAAIAPDGTVYVTSSNARLQALDPSGRQKWFFRTGSDIKSSPAIGDDGTIYFGSRDRKCYAVTPEGRQKWSFRVGAWVDSSPAIGADGTIYFGSWDNKFYAVNPEGRERWEFATEGPIDSSPAIGADGTIYFGSHDKKFYALYPDGKLKWAFETGGAIISSPAIAGDGTLYITSVDGNLYAVTPEGTKKWRLHTGGVRSSSPVLDEAGQIYIGVNNCLWIVNAAGTKEKWEFCVNDEAHTLHIDSSPAIVADGIFIFGSDQGSLYGFSATNNPSEWSVSLGGRVTASPTIAPDGTVYIGSNATKFHAVRGTKGLANSSWPKFRGNLRQTGRVSAAH
ncbi:MAG: Pyrrolo-quinoline quinone [Pedosphaera sp.]|nr:Pyrrolo-quinoline quinone [Pedosphaera sp.]